MTLISIDTALLIKMRQIDIHPRCMCGGFPECTCDRDDYTFIEQGDLQKVLRDKYGYHIMLHYSNDESKWHYVIQEFYKDVAVTLIEDDILYFKSYEEALESGLMRVITLIK